MSALIGPRVSTIRHLLGETVTEREFFTDTSEFGVWENRGPLQHRPPEFWVDLVHDACAADE